MKKIFTLIAATMMAVGAMADTETLFSMSIKSTVNAEVSSSGGSQDEECPLTSYADFGVTGTSAIFKQTASQGASGAKYIGKQSGVYYFALASSVAKAHFIITLAEAIQAGDVISYDMFGAKTADTYSLKFNTAASETNAVGPDAASPSADKEIMQHTYTVKAGDAIVGQKTIYVLRATAKSTYFDKLTITRGEGGSTTPADPTEATTWNFATTSDADASALAGSSDWEYDDANKRYSYNVEIAANTFKDLGDLGLTGGTGIEVGRTSKMNAGTIRVDVNNRLQLNCSNGQIRIPNLAKDDVVKIRFGSASGSEARTFTVTNGTPATINATVSTDPNDDTKTIADKLEAEITVTADGNLTLLQSKAINIYALAINTDLPAEQTTGINNIKASEGVKAASAKKYVEGKQIVIEKNGKKYNVAGAEIK